jgi:hypothetical protein
MTCDQFGSLGGVEEYKYVGNSLVRRGAAVVQLSLLSYYCSTTDPIALLLVPHIVSILFMDRISKTHKRATYTLFSEKRASLYQIS